MHIGNADDGVFVDGGLELGKMAFQFHAFADVTVRANDASGLAIAVTNSLAARQNPQVMPLTVAETIGHFKMRIRAGKMPIQCL